jgi:Mg2+-importing ATPase
LVIFIIRTRGTPLKSRPHPVLTATSLVVVAIAVVLPFTSIGAYFGLCRLPVLFISGPLRRSGLVANQLGFYR